MAIRRQFVTDFKNQPVNETKALSAASDNDDCNPLQHGKKPEVNFGKSAVQLEIEGESVNCPGLCSRRH